MKQIILVSSILALILTGISVAVAIDGALQGALVTNGIERFPGAMALIPIITLVAVVGVGFTLLAAIFSLVQSAVLATWHIRSQNRWICSFFSELWHSLMKGWVLP